MVEKLGVAVVATVATIDFEAEFADLEARLIEDERQRILPGLIRLWDGDWNYRGTVTCENAVNFQWLVNDSGIGRLELPEDYYLSEWLMDHKGRAKKNVHVTFDKDGARWDGRMDECEVVENEDGTTTVVVLFRHSYAEVQYIYCLPNPFLPFEIQFPRLWLLFGPAKWALSLTLLVNVMRLESSLWMLPDDPMDPAQWFNFDQSTWSMVVKPFPIAQDNSNIAIVTARGKQWHEVAKNILADAQLVVVTRRHLEGDPPPWPGANLRHGCLVISIEDKSGWRQETSFGGNLFTGLQRSFINIASDGLTEGVNVISDPTFPDLYKTPGYKGTLPQAPHVIYRHGKYSGITTSSAKYKPATAVQWFTGGHSMPGVNELISAGIQMAGDLIAAMLFVPPIGGAVDAVLKPLYTDTILAWMGWKSPARAQSLGWSHYKETFADGADRAYTLSALIALRAAMWRTREQYSWTLTVADGAPYRVGESGYGHFFLGDRIGSTIKGQPLGQVFVDQVTELNFGWDRETTPGWTITVGHREPEDPVVKLYSAVQDAVGVARDLGVL